VTPVLAATASEQAELIVFVVLAPLAVVTALGMVLTRNAVYSALLLVVNFFCLAGFYVLLEAQFVAAVQVIVYAGAIMVLFLFVVMLLDLGRPQWFDVAGLPLKILAGVLGAGFLAALVAGGLEAFQPPLPAATGATDALALDRMGSTEAIGSVLYTVYFVPFLTTALLLLVAMVGAVVIAARER
jgi:NADH-quinone oxidoreductase subunit J